MGPSSTYSSKDPESTRKTETTPLLVMGKMESSSSNKNVLHNPKITTTTTILEDAVDTFKLGVPIFIAMLSWVGMKSTDTALLGHVSREALSAAALSDLWTMCTAVFIQGSRVLDIFVGSAVGANNPKLAGIYLQVSYIVIGFVGIGVFVCWNFTKQIWIKFGSDPEISTMAGYYARILSFSIPGILIFSGLSQFFSAQRIMHPEVTASSFALLCNLIFGIIFVLGVPYTNFNGYGFVACPIVTTCVVYIQLLLIWYVYIHKQKLHEPCWDGWSPKEITWARIKTFSHLYFPAAMSGASDFWRVAVIGGVAAKLGEEEVAVFNTSYRIMWIVLVMVMAMAGASGINMSIRLGRNEPYGARQAGYIGIVLCSMFSSLIGLFVWIKVEWFGRIFTNDETFLELFAECRTPFAITLVLMNMSVAIEKVPYAMGRTQAVFWMGLVASWGAQVPAVLLCTIKWRDDLVGLYTGMAIGYAALVLLYSAIAFTSDWKKHAELARLRSESTEDSADE